MANNGMTPSENTRAVAAMVHEDDLEELEQLEQELVKRSDQARTDGRLFMMAQYVRLLSLVGPEVRRIRARFQRETLASLRKEHKSLKLERKNGATA